MDNNKDLESLIKLLKKIDTDGNEYILTSLEIKKIRKIIEYYNSSELMRNNIKEISDNYNENKDRIENVLDMLETYENIKGFVKVMVAIRNIILILTPIIGAWAVFKGWITVGMGG